MPRGLVCLGGYLFSGASVPEPFIDKNDIFRKFVDVNFITAQKVYVQVKLSNSKGV